MKVEIILEAGYKPAMDGLSLNKLRPVDSMPAVAERLAGKDLGHDKFLRMIDVWIDVNAPRFWWHEFDTYKIGRNHLPDDDEGDITTESASTMNNIKDHDLTQDDFEYPIWTPYLSYLNGELHAARAGTQIAYFKDQLPEGYLQRRILKINYAVAHNILVTRSTHRLPQWKVFCAALRTLEHQELMP